MERNELKIFLAKAAANGLCNGYSSKIGRCNNKKDIIDLALTAQGMEFLSRARRDGWFIERNYFLREFGQYLNGRYTYDERYSTQMYFCFKGALVIQTTAIMIVDSDITLTVPKYRKCQIYVSGNSRVSVTGEGECRAYIYGGDVAGNEKKLKIIERKDAKSE